MASRSFPRTALPLASALIVAACGAQEEIPVSNSYEDLLVLFEEWRAFESPALADGVPDYTAPAMAEQHAGLAALQRRLAAIDTTDWSIPQQVDYHLVRAEMNGLDFDHRVRRPWARIPAF